MQSGPAVIFHVIPLPVQTDARSQQPSPERKIRLMVECLIDCPDVEVVSYRETVVGNCQLPYLRRNMSIRIIQDQSLDAVTLESHRCIHVIESHETEITALAVPPIRMIVWPERNFLSGGIFVLHLHEGEH